MEFNWIKKGMIFKSDQESRLLKNYTQAPCPILVDGRLKIFYTARPDQDKDGSFVSYTSYIEVNPSNPSEVTYIHKDLVLDLGSLGAFDEYGIHPATLIQDGNDILFYYQGWERGYSVPYKTSIGLALSKDMGCTFNKLGKGPLFSRTLLEPFLENGFFVLKEKNKFYMWYGTCNEWINVKDKLEPFYFIVQASSDDGINWKRDSRPILSTVYEKEVSGRPTVIKIDNIYHMWFCYRDIYNFRNSSGAYKIGYAFSEDLISWKRDDENSGISLSENGWDSEMMAYPYVIKIENKLYLFYNGNNFGKNGFGYAEIIL